MTKYHMVLYSIRIILIYKIICHQSQNWIIPLTFLVKIWNKKHVMLEVFGFLLICRHVVVDTRHIIGFEICQELVKRLTSSGIVESFKMLWVSSLFFTIQYGGGQNEFFSWWDESSNAWPCRRLWSSRFQRWAASFCRGWRTACSQGPAASSPWCRPITSLQLRVCSASLPSWLRSGQRALRWGWEAWWDRIPWAWWWVCRYVVTKYRTQLNSLDV